MHTHNNLWKALIMTVAIGVATANALTPAGTLIRNQASATYQIGGEEYTSTSNEVVTEVLPVYGLDLLLNGQDISEATNPVVTQHAYVGNNVYFQYELRSYANTGDTVNITELVKDASSTMPDPSAIYIYEDVNGNGAVDPGEPLIGAWDPSTNSWANVYQDQDGDGNPDIYLPLNGSKFFILAYTIPTTANDGDVYVLGVSVESHGNASIVDPGTEGGNNYHKVIVSVDASIWASKSAAPQEVAQGDTVTYTISGSNVGGQTTDNVSIEYDNDEDGTSDGTLSGVILKDGIDTSLVYFAGGISGLPGGEVLYHYDGDGDNISYWQTDAPSDSTLVDSIAYVFPNIDPGQQFEFSFKVKVRDLEPNTQIHNRAIIEYGRQSASDTTFTTNDIIVTVSGEGAYQYVVFIGPYHKSDTTGSGGSTNTDIAAVDTVAAGACIFDTVTVSNHGNTSDEYDLTYSIGGAGDPDWVTSVSFLHMDGTTPIANNRIILAAGDSMDVMVRICIHDTVNTTSTDLDITLTATSVNQPDTFNQTHIVIDSIVGVSLDIGNYDGVAGSVNNAPADSTTNPGRCVTFPLDVLNNSGVSDVYSLSATLPDNWTVTFYPDEDGDGIADSTVPVTQIGPVAPGEEGHVVAVVCIPSNQSPGTQNVTFTATSTRDSTVSDAITNTVTVNAVCSIDIDPDRHATGFPGGVVTYQHRVMNLGNTSVSVTINVSSERGWTYVVLNSVGDEIISGPFTLDAGADSIINIRVFIPSDAAVGQADIATIEATTGTCTDTVTEVTEVIAGALQLTKYIMDPNHDGTADDSTFYSYGIPYSASTDSGTIWYRIHFKNISTDTVRKPVINEPIPTNTELLGDFGDSLPSGKLMYDYSSDGGQTWNGWTVTAPTDPSITNLKIGLDINDDNSVDEDDVLLPGQSGYIEFKVKIK